MFPDYLRAEHAARALLLMQHTPRLPVVARRLAFDRPVIFGSVTHFCRVTSTSLNQLSAGTGCLRDGCTLIRQKNGLTRYIVLYNDNSVSPQRQNFTLAHELGHIFLGHECDTDLEEREANHFAAELILPRLLASMFLRGLTDVLDYEHALAEAFDTSLTVAKIRLQSLRRNTPPTEQENALASRYGRLLPTPGHPHVTY